MASFLSTCQPINNTTQSALLSLLDKYEINPEQRRIIADASTKPSEYQEWFVDQFTRNR